MEYRLVTQCPFWTSTLPPWTSYCPEGGRKSSFQGSGRSVVTGHTATATTAPTETGSNRKPNQTPNPNGALRQDGLELVAAIAVMLLGMAM
jgi:hypothetical protein